MKIIAKYTDDGCKSLLLLYNVKDYISWSWREQGYKEQTPAHYINSHETWPEGMTLVWSNYFKAYNDKCKL